MKKWFNLNLQVKLGQQNPQSDRIHCQHLSVLQFLLIFFTMSKFGYIALQATLAREDQKFIVEGNSSQPDILLCYLKH